MKSLMKHATPRRMKIATAVALALGVISGLVDPVTASFAGGAMLSTGAHMTQGMKISVSSSVSPDNFSDIPDVTNIGGPTGSATVIDVTDFDSTAKEKVMGLMDEGQVSLDINYRPDNTVHELLRAQRAAKALCLFKITFTDSAPATTYTFSGYVTGFSVSGAVDSVLKASVTIEITGAITKA